MFNPYGSFTRIQNHKTRIVQNEIKASQKPQLHLQGKAQPLQQAWSGVQEGPVVGPLFPSTGVWPWARTLSPLGGGGSWPGEGTPAFAGSTLF